MSGLALNYRGMWVCRHVQHGEGTFGCQNVALEDDWFHGGTYELLLGEGGHEQPLGAPL